MLSRKLLGLHLILWMQPIALNSNTVHKNVQQSGGKERRMETSKRSPQLVPHHVSPTERRKHGLPAQRKYLYEAMFLTRSHAFFFFYPKLQKKAGLENLHNRANASQCVNAASPKQALAPEMFLSERRCFHAAKVTRHCHTKFWPLGKVGPFGKVRGMYELNN